MSDFATRLERSRAMYASGEEDARDAIAHDERIIGIEFVRTGYTRAEFVSYLLGAANARRSLVTMAQGGRRGLTDFNAHRTEDARLARRPTRRDG